MCSCSQFIPVLAGANPSAEGEDADEGEDAGDNAPVLDIADQFRLQKIEGGMSKKAYQAELKSMVFTPTRNRDEQANRMAQST